MHRIRSRANLLYFLMDVLLIIFSTYLPYILRFNKIMIVKFLTLPFIWKTLNLPSLSVYSFVFLFWGIVVILAFNNLGLYGTDRSLSIPAEVWLVFKGLFLSSLPVAAAVFLLKIAIFSRLVFGVAAVSMFLSLSLWRVIKRLIIRHLISRGYHNFNTLIIGAGRVGRTLVDEIHAHPYLGLRIIGFLDDNKKKGESIKGYEVLGRLSAFSRVVQQRFIEEVLITIPGAREKVRELLDKSRLHNISIKIIPDQFDLTLEIENVKNYRIGSLSVLEYSSRKIHGTELRAKRVMEFCEKLLKNEINLTWTCNSRAEKIDKETLRLMKMSGCHHICYGIESADEKILENINKNIDLGKARELLRLTKKAGITCRASFMFGNPGETEETMQKTLDFVMDVNPDFAVFNITTPYPGTPMYKWAKEKGYLMDEDWFTYHGSKVHLRLPTISPEKIEEFQKYAFKKFYFRPKYIMSRLLKIRTKYDIQFSFQAFKSIAKL